MTPQDPWLAAIWPFVRDALPAAPARGVEIGCGPLGGFVPVLRSAGYQATGVDPEAPREPWYRRAEFERAGPLPAADAIVACTSLHHVADLAEVLDLVDAALVPGGAVIVVEWARERFDADTARWCFDRLPEPDDDENWLSKHRARWREAGQPWEDYIRSWAEAEGLHAGQVVLDGLYARFGSSPAAYGPYFFADLTGTSEADEQAAIDRGLIRACGIRYAGHKAG